MYIIARALGRLIPLLERQEASCQIQLKQMVDIRERGGCEKIYKITNKIIAICVKVCDMILKSSYLICILHKKYLHLFRWL